MFATALRFFLAWLGLLLLPGGRSSTAAESGQHSRVTEPPPIANATPQCQQEGKCGGGGNGEAGRRLLGDMGIADHRDTEWFGTVDSGACKQAISLGGFHTCVIEMVGKAHGTGQTVGAYKEGGTARCWGKNNWGQASDLFFCFCVGGRVRTASVIQFSL